uniref:Uncharacterized protein n=1 Tax=Odontella aurita TaxID=265563 RepID=A0A7S4JA02_9STRA
MHGDNDEAVIKRGTGPLVPAEARMTLTASGAVAMAALSLHSPPNATGSVAATSAGHVGESSSVAQEDNGASTTAQHLTLVAAKLSAQQHSPEVMAEDSEAGKREPQPETVPEPMESEGSTQLLQQTPVQEGDKLPRQADIKEQYKKKDEEDGDTKPRRRTVTREQATRLRRRMQGIIDDPDENDEDDGPPKEPIRPKCLPVPSHLVGRDSVLLALSEGMSRGALIRIDLSQRGLRPADARPLAEALFRNPSLESMRLGFNDLGDEGAAMLAAAVKRAAEAPRAFAATGGGDNAAALMTATATHHRSLSLLDLGFNGVGDGGCRALAEWAVAGNPTLRTLYLSGNTMREGGALTLAAAMVQGRGCSGLRAVHVAANPIGSYGTKALTRAVAEVEARRVARLAAIGAAGGVEMMVAPGIPGTTMGAGAIGAAAIAAAADASVQELYLGGTEMGPDGCLSVSNMLLTNFALRVLSLADCGLDDADLSLFSQAASRNKHVPFETLELSRNNLTCAGVESLMNAIWGSPTLRVVRLDNNRIRDRGAQLCAVVLTSVRLAVLDLGFNRVTAAGVKALMKSLAENDGLRELTLSGIKFDTNSAKAISYALAYNSSLVAFGADKCSVGYAAQRHIAAGIVSNPKLSLRRLTGFRIGAIAATLGLPSALEGWGNSRCLAFVRHMWERRRRDEENEERENGVTKRKAGPANPQTVVSAAQAAFPDFDEMEKAEALSWNGQAGVADGIWADGCPVSPDAAVLLERTASGGIRAIHIPSPSPSEDEEEPSTHKEFGNTVSPLTGQANGKKAAGAALGSSVASASSEALEVAAAISDPVKRARITDWLKQHFRCLSEMAREPFNNADLLSLQQHYYSPISDVSAMPTGDSFASTTSVSFTHLSSHPPTTSVSSLAGMGTKTGQGKSSFRHLNDAASSSSFAPDSASNLRDTFSSGHRRNRRRSVELMMEESEDEEGELSRRMQPACKRARNTKPRIAYYPRLWKKLEVLRTEANQHRTLALMRQLKFVESTLLQGRNIYSEGGVEVDPKQPSPSDVDVILVDVLL